MQIMTVLMTCGNHRRFIEETTPDMALKMRLNKVLFDEKSDF